MRPATFGSGKELERLYMPWANKREVAAVEGVDAADAQSFGHRHDRCVNETDACLGIPLDELGDAR